MSEALHKAAVEKVELLGSIVISSPIVCTNLSVCSYLYNTVVVTLEELTTSEEKSVDIWNAFLHTVVITHTFIAMASLNTRVVQSILGRAKLVDTVVEINEQLREVAIRIIDENHSRHVTKTKQRAVQNFLQTLRCNWSSIVMTGFLDESCMMELKEKLVYTRTYINAMNEFTMKPYLPKIHHITNIISLKLSRRYSNPFTSQFRLGGFNLLPFGGLAVDSLTLIKKETQDSALAASMHHLHLDDINGMISNTRTSTTSKQPPLLANGKFGISYAGVWNWALVHVKKINILEFGLKGKGYVGLWHTASVLHSLPFQTPSGERHPFLQELLGVALDPTGTFAYLVSPLSSSGSLREMVASHNHDDSIKDMIPHIGGSGGSVGGSSGGGGTHLSASQTSTSQKESINVATKLSIMIDVANALKFLHERGHIHGRLKDTNVLLYECPPLLPNAIGAGTFVKYRARLSDFGINPFLSENTFLACLTKNARWTAPEFAKATLKTRKASTFGLGGDLSMTHISNMTDGAKEHLTAEDMVHECTIQEYADRGIPYHCMGPTVDIYGLALICLVVLTMRQPFHNLAWFSIGVVSDETFLERLADGMTPTFPSNYPNKEELGNLQVIVEQCLGPTDRLALDEFEEMLNEAYSDLIEEDAEEEVTKRFTDRGEIEHELEDLVTDKQLLSQTEFEKKEELLTMEKGSLYLSNPRQRHLHDVKMDEIRQELHQLDEQMNTVIEDIQGAEDDLICLDEMDEKLQYRRDMPREELIQSQKEVEWCKGGWPAFPYMQRFLATRYSTTPLEFQVLMDSGVILSDSTVQTEHALKALFVAAGKQEFAKEWTEAMRSFGLDTPDNEEGRSALAGIKTLLVETMLTQLEFALKVDTKRLDQYPAGRVDLLAVLKAGPFDAMRNYADTDDEVEESEDQESMKNGENHLHENDDDEDERGEEGKQSRKLQNLLTVHKRRLSMPILAWRAHKEPTQSPEEAHTEEGHIRQEDLHGEGQGAPYPLHQHIREPEETQKQSTGCACILS